MTLGAWQDAPPSLCCQRYGVAWHASTAPVVTDASNAACPTQPAGGKIVRAEKGEEGVAAAGKKKAPAPKKGKQARVWNDGTGAGGKSELHCVSVCVCGWWCGCVGWCRVTARVSCAVWVRGGGVFVGGRLTRLAAACFPGTSFLSS